MQNVDVLLDEETNKVNFIFIRANENFKDSTIINQLNWNRGKSFLINKSVLKMMEANTLPNNMLVGITSNNCHFLLTLQHCLPTYRSYS